MALVAAKVFALEVQTAWLQSAALAAAGRHIVYAVGPGPSPTVRYPTEGPHNARLGYTRQPDFVRRLQGEGFVVAEQARWSPLAQSLADAGLFPIYGEKGQAGLVILDRQDRPLHVGAQPSRVYARFEDIPPLIVESLLFVENRELLRERGSRQNPAIEYARLARAVLGAGRLLVDPGHPVSGGSTLATQLEKVRHSPEGRTDSLAEKARQMASASLRAYRQGERTTDARRQIVRDYVNALPLGAIRGHGEVIGLPDGLWAWYGAEVDRVNRLLDGAAVVTASDRSLPTRAAAYRQALSLLLAARRPTTYLVHDPAALDSRVDSYLRVLANAGVISTALRDAALSTRLQRRARVPVPPASFAERKGADGVRMELISRLGLADTYELDRLDVAVRTTLDGAASVEVSRVLRELGSRAAARKAGLVGERLLGDSRPDRVIYSLTLFERGTEGNLLRVQADNHDQPLNINEGTRLELGSTAKLRTLVTYLEVVERLHRQYASLSSGTLRGLPPDPQNRLRTWAAQHLAGASDRSLERMIDAALERRYSASPFESFFTGGGVHHFHNFDARHDDATLTVRQAFRDSVNLVFIRLMRDLTAYFTYENAEWAGVLEDATHPARQAYLVRFADREGREYLRRFHQEHGASTPATALENLARRARGNPVRLAAIFRAVRPEAPVASLDAFLRAQGVGQTLTSRRVQALFEQSDPTRWGWQDLGYLARVHPLELWLVQFLQRHPGASLEAVIRASAAERQDAYRWLYRTSNARARQRAVETLVEENAFGRIHASWRRQGYPFDALVPSYATALGSSGDNPEALSELLGIIQNDGVRVPVVRIATVHFGDGTPYDTRLARQAAAGERVLSTAVASALGRELVGVVEHGTGRRLAGGVTLPDGQVLPIGGKTGTGDNRYTTLVGDGRRSRVINRTATFTFTIGDRYFGTIVAYVPGPEAARYEFTSALPVQLLKELLPVLAPLLAHEAPDHGGARRGLETGDAPA